MAGFVKYPAPTCGRHDGSTRRVAIDWRADAYQLRMSHHRKLLLGDYMAEHVCRRISTFLRNDTKLRRRALPAR